MATTTISWGDGSGDNIYLTCDALEGDQTVLVSSDANTGSARTKTVTFSATGVTPVILTVSQAEGVIPGSLISDYVQDGLLFLLDGKNKGNVSGAWTSVAGNTYSFTNHGATFGTDYVQFDGVDDYLQGTSPGPSPVPSRTAGTVEVVCDFENHGTSGGSIFLPRTNNRIGIYFSSDGILYGIDNTSSRNYYYPVRTLSKASWSVSSARQYENGVSMTLSDRKNYIGGVNTSYNLIGKRNNSSTPAFFKGKIYSIRIYTKQLTDAEVLQNLSVDNLRFNLGLTLE